jgi:hypothetical protein
MAMNERETGLTRTEADRRKGLLGQLQDALADRRITSAVAGRRVLVLHSARDGGRGYLEPVRLADPQLYVFAAGGTDVVTTDGEVYWLTGGCPHTVADPCGAARVYARWSAR